MNGINRRGAILIIALIGLVVLACNFPGFMGDKESSLETPTPEPGLTIVFPSPTPAVTDAVTPVVTLTKSADENEECTLRAAFVDDVTVPDDTVMDEEEKFLKTWRIRNSGTCRWESGTVLKFLSGDKLGEANPVAVPVTEPGGEAELSVEMQAPAKAGDYRSNWQLTTADGESFGGVFYVKIIVEEESESETEPEESVTLPQHFIGKTSVDCKKITFSWQDGSGEESYIVSGSAISEVLAADTTSYTWQNPPADTSVITLTAKKEDGSVIGNLKTVVNVNCGSQRPNLLVQKMRFEPEKPVAYLPLTVTMEIKNAGPVDSGAFVARWWKVTTLLKNTCEWYVNEGLRAGDTSKLSCTVDPYSSINDFVVRGDADVTQAVVESDEIDNVSDKTISVIAPVVHYDFVSEASSAVWTAGPPSQKLVWPGIDTDAQGYARWITGELENGEFASDPCLQTHPSWTSNGWIQGAYENMLPSGYMVQAGDLFSANIAFLKDAAGGDVTYKVLLKPEGTDPVSIAGLPHKYGDGIGSIDVDLSSYAGQKASFIFKVDAGSSANYDWACWLNAVIYRYPPSVNP